jgi:hypothetical protein
VLKRFWKQIFISPSFSAVKVLWQTFQLARPKILDWAWQQYTPPPQCCWGGTSTTERTFHFCWRVKSSYKLVLNWFEWSLPATNLSLLPLVISSWVMFCACVHV